jgi:ribosome-associated protein
MVGNATPERDTLRVTASLHIPLDEIDVRFETSGGAGGQHANRSHTRVELSFDVAASAALGDARRERIVAKLGPVVRAHAADSRSQTRNRELAMERLATKLAAALHVDPVRRPTRPTKGSVRRRLDAKRQAGERKAMRRRPSIDD